MKLHVLLLVGGGMVAAAHAEGTDIGRLVAPAAAPRVLLAQADSGATPLPPTDAAPQPQEASPAPVSPTTATVDVVVENVEVDRGKVWLALCSTALSIDGCPYKESVPATAAFVEAKFENIPPGAYAVAAYQDLNDNGVFDKILGVPREPYALSGAAANELVPRFRDAALEMHVGDNNVVIHLKRLGQ
jgi:uncharacterized protein (DUF2141 family)